MGVRAALLILLGLVLMSQEVNSRAGRGHKMGSVLLYYALMQCQVCSMTGWVARVPPSCPRTWSTSPRWTREG